jgi:hypothetical protein
MYGRKQGVWPTAGCCDPTSEVSGLPLPSLIGVAGCRWLVGQTQLFWLQLAGCAGGCGELAPVEGGSCRHIARLEELQQLDLADTRVGWQQAGCVGCNAHSGGQSGGRPGGRPGWVCGHGALCKRVSLNSTPGSAAQHHHQPTSSDRRCAGGRRGAGRAGGARQLQLHAAGAGPLWHGGQRPGLQALAARAPGPHPPGAGELREVRPPTWRHCAAFCVRSCRHCQAAA